MSTNYSTKQAASLLQVSPNTLRNWSDQYSEFLAPSARAGAQPERRFTDKDITLLSYIRQLRSEGMKEPHILERLNETKFQDMELLDKQPVSIQTHTNDLQIEQEPLQTRELATIYAIERRLAAVEASKQQDSSLVRHGIAMLALGALLMLLFVVLILLLLILARHWWL